MRFKIISLHANVNKEEILEEYRLDEVRVSITKNGEYIINEPLVNEELQSMYEKLMEALFLSLKPLAEVKDPLKYMEEHIYKEAEELDLKNVQQVFPQLRYYLVRDVLGYGILDTFMKDDRIEEITCERYDRNIGVVHRDYTQFNILDSNVTFSTIDAMNSYVQRLMQRSGKSITAATPIADAVTKEGDRIMVTYGKEVSLPGPTLDIRKFPRQPFVITHLLKFNTLNPLMAAYIWLLLDAKGFGLIVGETGSGKTTMINSLMSLTNPKWKIITIEETPELKIPHYRWARLVTRSSANIVDTKFDIGIMELVKGTLRMRPDFLIVGEVRGTESYTLFQSAATGHGGLTSFHATDPLAALNRLSAEPINIKPSQQMLLWFIIHLKKVRLKGGRVVRRVMSIVEIIPKDDKVVMQEIFKYDVENDRFNIDNIKELITKSNRIKQAAELLGVKLEEDLEKRLSLINICIEKNADSIDDVFNLVQRYYDYAPSNGM
ncbi:MAG: type II/IV secretion system ATPase subunit [Candidatus Nitrosocaldaceae archaeon]